MIPKKLAGLYKGLSPKELFYISARWAVSPMKAVERAIPPEGKIYDIGCGAGLLSNFAAMNSDRRDITGIDLSEDRISIAKKSVAGRRNINFERADVMKFDFLSPDVIMACDVLHHMPYTDQESLLKRICQAIKSGGLILIQDIDKRPWHKYFFGVLSDKIINRMAPAYYRTEKEFISLLKGMGFEVESSRIDKWYPTPSILLKCTKTGR
jgi:2-polyprenyl-3-methyl-5-hydroxy-6-metoxy-1,4-benzoquinol methylase